MEDIVRPRECKVEKEEKRGEKGRKEGVKGVRAEQIEDEDLPYARLMGTEVRTDEKK